MKAVILAAGKSTRTYPLTLTRPKPLLKVANKMILAHNLEQLNGIVDEAIIIVGYKKEMIMQTFGNKFMDIILTYVEQKEQLGTGHALLCAKEHLNDRFIIMPGDDLFSKNDINDLVSHDYAILTKEVDDPEKFGIVDHKDGFVTGFEEKPKNPKSNLVNTALWVMDKKLIDLMEKQEKTGRGEYELPCALKELIKTDKVACVEVKDYWLPIGYPWDLLSANEFLLSKLERSDFRGETEEGVTVNGKVVLGKGSRIMAGTYIEGNVIIGENCKIGPNAYIRGNTSIGNNCRVGPAEIKNCVFFDNVHCDHVSYIGDSVLGFGSHMGAHTVVANLRHDGANVKSMVKGELVGTGRRKFGTIIGDDVDTGINTSIYPGRKIWPGCFTVPGEIIKKDVEKNE